MILTKQLYDKYYDFMNELYDSLMKEYRMFGDETTWVMKNGDEIQIKDMKMSHIKNCINMMKRLEDNGRRRAWIEIFESELINRRINKVNKIKRKINESKVDTRDDQ